MTRSRLAAALLALCAAAPLAAQALSPAEAERVAREAAAQLRSPVTPSHTLDMCPAAEAQALRDTMVARAATGVPAARLVEEVVARRGEELRLVPKRQGLGWLAWIATPAVLLLGAAMVAGKLRSLRGGDRAPAPPAETLSADDRERLAAAMAEYDRSGPGEE